MTARWNGSLPPYADAFSRLRLLRQPCCSCGCLDLSLRSDWYSNFFPHNAEVSHGDRERKPDANQTHKQP